MLEADAHGVKYARDTFAEYGIDLPDNATDAAVVNAYNSILDAAAIMACPADDFFRAIRNLNDFSTQPRLSKPIPDLNELFR